MELMDFLSSTTRSKADIRSRIADIYNGLLGESRWIREPNFTSIHSRDLEFLYREYDRLFFDGLLSAAADRHGTPLSFRVSKRMTRVGGTTTKFRRRSGPGPRSSYEIAVSSTLLFSTFYDIDRPITVTGVLCRNRLECLQRIFEHELIHLTEMVVWDDSSCSRQRFQSLAFQFFTHTEATHQLITPGERAQTKFGIRPGDRVRFRVDGARYEGFVNRITKRATVLVEDENSPLYSDGKRYARFYVPLGMLEPVR
jgi:hypothetical protein